MITGLATPGEAVRHLHRPSDAIDRWAAIYQRARLWERRARRLLVAAVTTGDATAAHTSRVRVRRAQHWEAFAYERYLAAVFAEYC